MLPEIARIKLKQENWQYLLLRTTWEKIRWNGKHTEYLIKINSKSAEFWKSNLKFVVSKPWKPPSTELCENRRVSKISCPPYCFRYFEFQKSDVKFITSEPKSLWIQSLAEIVWFSTLHVRHIGSPLCEGYGYLKSVRQFFSCSLTIPITFDHSYDQVPILFWPRKKVIKKNSRFFGTFLQIWHQIEFLTGPNSILTTDSWRAYPKHGFRLEISFFQSWEWGLNIS